MTSKKAIIFLDVDGVLNSDDYYASLNGTHGYYKDIDIEKVKLLRQICDATGAKIVISSSWRGSDTYTPRIYWILRNILAENGIDVIGDTPFVKTELDDVCREVIGLDGIVEEYNIKFGTGRAEEVHRWIVKNNPESFVILDDESWNWAEYGYDKNWIQPHYFGDNGGLHTEHVEKAIKILNGE